MPDSIEIAIDQLKLCKRRFDHVKRERDALKAALDAVKRELDHPCHHPDDVNNEYNCFPDCQGCIIKKSVLEVIERALLGEKGGA
jgi:hypothetical protein